jgi:hypothetical protein
MPLEPIDVQPKRTHWQKAVRFLVDLIDPGECFNGLRASFRKSYQWETEFIVVEVQYTQREGGARMARVVLFEDGTWRFEPF